jgi:hypothetical protein
MKITVNGWDQLPFTVREDVLAYIKRHGLPWEILSGTPMGYSDILMEVDHGGFHNWSERIKAFLGALIYMLLHATLNGQPSVGSMALDMAPPVGVPTAEMEH